MDAPATILATDSAEAARATREKPWLAYVPVALFAVVMGTGGLDLSWRVANRVLGVPEAVSHIAAAALATAALVSTATLAIAVTLLATAIVLTVFACTAQALVRRRLFVPE